MSRIIIENDIRDRLADFFADKNIYIITDENVYKLLDGKIKSKYAINVLPAGENSKTLKTVEHIITDLISKGYDRTAVIVAIGGGVIGDIAGLVSGLYMRGTNWINIPTTLLSQSDSCLGGKTGVNLGGYKNIIGVFHEPGEIIISLHFLNSLDDKAWLSGMGEIIKTGFLDAELYNIVQTNFEKIKQRNPGVMREVIERCLAIKRKITDADLREHGLRKRLNIGHTVGHALETYDNYSRSHGEYILWGMRYENLINKSFIEPIFYLKMQTMISRALLGISEPKFDIDAVAEMCEKDKKNNDGFISLMAVKNAGNIEELRYKSKQFRKELKNAYKTDAVF